MIFNIIDWCLFPHTLLWLILINQQSCLWMDKMSFDSILQINYKWSKLCTFQRNYQWPLGILHIQLHFKYENMLEPFLFCRPIWYSYLVMDKIILPRNRSNARSTTLETWKMRTSEIDSMIAMLSSCVFLKMKHEHALWR